MQLAWALLGNSESSLKITTVTLHSDEKVYWFKMKQILTIHHINCILFFAKILWLFDFGCLFLSSMLPLAWSYVVWYWQCCMEVSVMLHTTDNIVRSVMIYPLLTFKCMRRSLKMSIVHLNVQRNFDWFLVDNLR